jgi:hypothetical protein
MMELLQPDFMTPSGTMDEQQIFLALNNPSFSGKIIYLYIINIQKRHLPHSLF